MQILSLELSNILARQLKHPPYCTHRQSHPFQVRPVPAAMPAVITKETACTAMYQCCCTTIVTGVAGTASTDAAAFMLTARIQ